MPLGRLSISVSLARSIYYAYFHSITKNVIIFRATLPTVGRFSFQKSISWELWLLHNPEPRVEVYWNKQRYYVFDANTHIH
jgi:hypothetical protein